MKIFRNRLNDYSQKVELQKKTVLGIHNSYVRNVALLYYLDAIEFFKISSLLLYLLINVGIQLHKLCTNFSSTESIYITDIAPFFSTLWH